MPKVPDFLPSVAERPAQDPQLSGQQVQPMGGAGSRQIEQLGAAVQGAGETVMSIADKLQGEHNEARATEAEALYLDSISSTLRNPDNGYLNTVGKAAGDNRGSAIDSIMRARTDAEQILQNPDQREHFARRAEAHERSAAAAINVHAAEQTRVYAVGESKTRVGLMQNAAIEYRKEGPQGPAVDPAYDAVMRDEVNRLADLMGWAKDSSQRKALMLDTTTGMHEELVRQLIATGRSDQARIYLERVGKTGEIEQRALGQLQERVQQGAISDQSLRLVNRLRALPNHTARVQEVEKLFEDNKITAEVHDATLNRLEGVQQQEARAHSNEKAATFAGVQTYFAQPGNETKTWNDLPADVQTNLSRLGLAAETREWIANKGLVPTTREGFVDMEGISDIELRSLSPGQVWDRFFLKLNKKHFDSIESRYRKLRGEPETAIGARTRSIERMTMSSAVRLGVMPAEAKTATQAQLDKYDVMLRKIDDTLGLKEASSGEKATRDDVQEILDMFEIDYVIANTPGVLWGVNMVRKPMVTLDKDEVADATVRLVRKDGTEEYLPIADIPAKWKASIARDLGQNGFDATAENIGRVWLKVRPAELTPKPGAPPRKLSTQSATPLRDTGYYGFGSRGR